MDKPHHILERFWQYSSFRQHQEEIISYVLEGRDTLALLPTGGGKSLCFQIPALLKPGICLVISPLIALMKDQVDSLRGRGIKALVVHSGMSFAEIDIALDNAIYGEYKFLYISPERLRTDIFRIRAAKMDISLIAVDEAHCISQWGYDFRPDYLLINEIKEIVGEVPIIALTATATPTVASDIIDKLNLKNPAFVKGDFERENLSFVARFTEDKLGSLLKIVRGVEGTGIVYVRERKSAEEVAHFLLSQGIEADAYHAGFSPKARIEKQNDWLLGKNEVIVATNAFGMGIDKSDVRFVCHFDIPESLEAYYQEAGRAGRDGKLSYCVILWNNNDIKRVKQIVKMSYPDPAFIELIYQKLYRYNDIAYGDGRGVAVRFSLKEFCIKNKMHSSSVYYSIKYLQNLGILELTEELDIPSKMTFIVNRDELYIVQLKSSALDSFIKSLLRLYEGLFSGYVSINEEYIARATRNSVAGVVSLLERLSIMNIISYQSGARSPLLIFKEEREREGHFKIDLISHQGDKDIFEGRIERMLSYVHNNEICRSGLLVEYFGQKEWRECKICDTCLSKKRQRERSLSERELVERVLAVLKESPRSIDELEMLTGDGSGLWKEVLRDLLDRGVIRLNGELLVAAEKFD